MTKLVTHNFKLHTVKQLQESLNESANTVYYVYVGQHINRTTSTLPTPTDRTREVMTDAYRTMLFGKRVAPSDVRIMARKIPYESNKVFAMYDCCDTKLYEKDFYCVVDEDSFLHVYKCLDNNFDAQSTVEPSFAHISGSNSHVYQTSDGYRWKYMYSYSSIDDDKFSTDLYMPVLPNTEVTSSAVEGAVDIVVVDTTGRNYNNYTSGTFNTTDVRVSGNTLLYRISNTELSQVNGFYTDCVLYITSGDGSGEYRDVSHYFSNASGSFVVVNNAFSNSPTNGSTFDINPKVRITGDGSQTINAVGRALVNALATNSIYRVEMLNRGADYQYAEASVLANTVVGVSTNAVLRVILGPKGGHGFNAASELGAHHFGFGVTFSNNESNTIITQNDFEKVGIIIDPMFANVSMVITNANGAFSVGEKINKITPYRVETNATINTTSTVLNCSNADFTNQFAAGDFIYIKSGDGINHMLATVNNVSNGSSLRLTSNGFFACTESILYKANVSSNAYITEVVSPTSIRTTNVAGQFGTGDVIIGMTSGAKAEISSIVRNGVTKGFETFIQMYKYTGAVTSGNFTLDEVVYQGSNVQNADAKGYLHSVVLDGANASFYVSNQTGIVSTSKNLEGNTSGATASLTGIYSPELIPFSGDVISIENIETVTRANTQSETFKLIFEF